MKWSAHFFVHFPANGHFLQYENYYLSVVDERANFGSVKLKPKKTTPNDHVSEEWRRHIVLKLSIGSVVRILQHIAEVVAWHIRWPIFVAGIGKCLLHFIMFSVVSWTMDMKSVSLSLSLTLSFSLCVYVYDFMASFLLILFVLEWLVWLL